ncbi:transposase [Allocoprobacillus halotolerans]|uniref:Transposase n=1 Tax=Allocoprobacillus halotolerans TaxID=2944914 RepID=A0ABY5I125_9FIRM|nr:transposase [Allocoprobacillus halotolerans]UTY39009.1 transposase [Allocoprobacillus halotolerans]
MIDISHIFSLSHHTRTQSLSLCGYLEAIVGKYFLSQSGNPDSYWYAVYYGASINSHDDCVEIIDHNLIGYVYYDNRVAFILNDYLETFMKDTLDYDIHYISLDSLDKECLECQNDEQYRQYILPALWIDDDFLYNERIPFDYEKFELIDEGVQYLNPKHFSVKNFVKSCQMD